MSTAAEKDFAQQKKHFEKLLLAGARIQRRNAKEEAHKKKIRAKKVYYYGNFVEDNEEVSDMIIANPKFDYCVKRDKDRELFGLKPKNTND